jgi:hypothetical protein
LTARSVFLAAAVAALAAHSASAREPHSYPSDDDPRYLAGDSNNLPIGPGTDLASAIAHARTMPAVLSAINVCRLRGYVRREESDSGYVQPDPPLTIVILAFEKPGLTPPAGMLGTPIVQIGTALGADAIRSTQVSGGLVFFELADGTPVLADDVPGYRFDGSFDIHKTGGTGGVYHTERIVQCLRDYFVCAGVGNSACVMGALLSGPPVVAAIRGTVCVAANTFRCAYSFVTCW